MNLNVIRLKNRTEGLLLSITKICETLIEQANSKPENTLEFKLIKPKEIIHLHHQSRLKEIG